jgi:hypothetical protein
MTARIEKPPDVASDGSILSIFAPRGYEPRAGRLSSDQTKN